ncbi:MAG: CAP domain-containing protein [Rubricoccaceae bacterium]|nr:CAP domain-containing protein [Rubricoccaceae bacterium]
MRTLQLALWIIACTTTSGCDGVIDLLPTSGGADVVPAEWGEMLVAVNQLRAEGRDCGGTYYGPVEPLAWNRNLASAAIRHSNDMAEHDHFAHVGTDGSTVGDRVSQAGYEWREVGENIAHNQQSISEVVEAWANSSGHCANIMGDGFVEIGAAETDRYWTQVFGRPR